MSIKSVNSPGKVGEVIKEASSTIKGIAEGVKDNLKFQPPQVLYGPAPSTEEIEELDLDNLKTPENIISDQLIQHEQYKYGPAPGPTEPSEIVINLQQHEQYKYGPAPGPTEPSEIVNNLQQHEQYKYGPAPNNIVSNPTEKFEKIKAESRAREKLSDIQNLGETPATFDYKKIDNDK